MDFLIQGVTVLLEGIISFFSPCVIPLLPLYMGYLAGNAKEKTKDGKIIYKRKKVFLYTLFFVLGISMSFFILGLSFTTLGSFFKEYKTIIAIIGGIIIVILGLFQLKIINFKSLQKEKKLNININPNKMNPIVAFVMGFLFSFAWTPCVGPALSSVLIMASSADSMLLGNILVLIYAIGFIIPFLILGLFTGEALSFLKKKQNILQRVVQVGGVLLVLVGSYILVTNIDFETSSKLEQNCGINEETGLASCSNGLSSKTNKKSQYKVEKFTLKDQNNKTHNWNDYKDKTVILHFWSTDCSACKKELKELEKLYNHYKKNTNGKQKQKNISVEYNNSNKKNKEDVILLSVVSPKLEHKSTKQIKNFIKNKDITFPVLMDETGEFFSKFEIISYPNSFIVKDSVIKLTIPGATTYEKLTESVEEIKSSK